ncbi:FAD synthase [Candidatus Uhrbacteria bacterium]|nr:FAD synthase [Candidatus Uhrbacteria bacterium]
MKTVLCFGTFDGLHPGHEDYFRQAKALAHRLVVIVARDETVQEVKGRASRFDQDARVRSVADHPLVTQALLGQPGDKYDIIQQIRPDVILLGYDQTTFTDRLAEELNRRALVVDIQRAKAYHPEVYKSSKMYA